MRTGVLVFSPGFEGPISARVRGALGLGFSVFGSRFSVLDNIPWRLLHECSYLLKSFAHLSAVCFIELMPDLQWATRCNSHETFF